MNQWQTRQSLLQRAKDPTDEQAWDEFVHFYQGFIEVVLRQMQLNKNDFDDLKQEVLLQLWKALPTYEHQRARFRTWLSQIIRNKVIDFFRKVKRTRSQTVTLDPGQTDSFISEDEIEAIVTREWETHIVELAINRIREHFTDRAVNAFQMSLDGKSTSEIGQALGIKTDSAQKLVKRFKFRLMEEIELLKMELEP